MMPCCTEMELGSVVDRLGDRQGVLQHLHVGSGLDSHATFHIQPLALPTMTLIEREKIF